MSQYMMMTPDYGTMARDYWQQHLPQRYAAIEDPQAYFNELGAEVRHQIGELWGQMRAQTGNPAGEDFIERVGRLNAMKKQAEEIVLADLVLLPPERQDEDEA